MDTGLCAYLGKWPSADILENGPLAGNFYETFVVSEIIKSFLNKGISNKLYNELSLYYYRDRDQKEVDLIIETFKIDFETLRLKFWNFTIEFLKTLKISTTHYD